MLLEKITYYEIILATQSPRRHSLMKGAGFSYNVIIPEGIEEVFPETMEETEVPVYLAKLKASWFVGKLTNKQIIITADTIVAYKGKVLGKPGSLEEAVEMLSLLSGRTHDVVTGVCFLSLDKEHAFSSVSRVHFRKFSKEEIFYYVNNYKPLDKAGSYGAQEWIGYVGIEWIEGSYFNVMGLPIQQVYTELEKFIS